MRQLMGGSRRVKQGKQGAQGRHQIHFDSGGFHSILVSPGIIGDTSTRILGAAKRETLGSANEGLPDAGASQRGGPISSAGDLRGPIRAGEAIGSGDAPPR
jgi:hypothetical protein